MSKVECSFSYGYMFSFQARAASSFLDRDNGVVTQASNDGGIGGVIDQDALGLSKIYVQAKRYGKKNSGGPPEVQSFVGAMHGLEGTGRIYYP